jgi:hypothetical protein
MWVRKSDQQVVKRPGRVLSFFRAPMAWFLVGFVVSVGIALRGPMYPVRSFWPATWSEILLRASQIGLALAIVVLALQLILRRSISFRASSAKVVICNKCHRVKHRDRDGACECGGNFEDFDNWTWIED